MLEVTVLRPEHHDNNCWPKDKDIFAIDVSRLEIILNTICLVIPLNSTGVAATNAVH